MSAKPIRVAVLTHDGTLLGYVTRRPTGGNWRTLGNLPRIILNGRPSDGGPRTKECTHASPCGGWAVFLRENENPPPNMEKP